MGSGKKSSDVKELQQQLIENYKEELEKNRASSKKEKVAAVIAQDPVATAAQKEDPLLNKINYNLDAFHKQMQVFLESLEGAFDEQYLQWREIHGLIEQERRVLSEAYGVAVPPDSIAAIVKLRQERKDAAEKELVQTKANFEEEMNRRRMEFQLKEEALQEKLIKKEDELALQAQQWEQQLIEDRQNIAAIELELKKKRAQQESLWIARSEELEMAYNARYEALESQYLQKIEAINEELIMRDQELEKDWAQRQSDWEREVNSQRTTLQKLQEQIREKGDELSRVNAKAMDLVSRKTSTDENAPRRTLPIGGNRIVRPMKSNKGSF